MTFAQEQLLRSLSNVLFDVPTIVNITSEIYEEAKLQAVSTLISKDYVTLAENIRVMNAHAELTNILESIPFTTFKGFASAYYYPEPVKRPLGDIDFIIDQACCSEVLERLKADGWIQSGKVHKRHISFKKGKVEIELHTEIKGIPNGADGIVTESETVEMKVRELLSDLITTARTIETQQGLIVIPDDFHHGLIMLLHVAGHLINDGGVGLRHLCDWAVYVNCVDLERYRKKLENVGLWMFACQLTAVSSKYLGLKEMDWAGKWPDDFLSSIIEDILNAGNFGCKEAGRRTALDLQHRSFADLTKERYSLAKNAMLLPVFMIVNLFRYGFLLLSQKRKVIKLSTFEKAKERDILYKQFRLFEV